MSVMFQEQASLCIDRTVKFRLCS